MRVLIADDHPMFLDAVSANVARAFPGCVIDTVSSVGEVLDQAGGGAGYDLIVLDHSMPGMDGTDGIGRVMARFAGVPVAVISGVAGRGDVMAAIHAGARGFLPKTLPSAAFAAALGVIASGGTYLPTEMLDQAKAPLDAQPPRTGGDDERMEQLLTPREQDVLTCIAKGQSNKEIARSLDIREVTVKLHARSIFKKLGVKNRSQAAVAALERHLVKVD